MAVIFWICVVFLAYTFVGYPLVLWLVALVRRRPCRRAPVFPTVSVIIAVHNGEEAIEAKIRNTLQLQYPPDGLEILVASDGSTDRTPELAARFASQGVKLIEMPERRGKHYAQFSAASSAAGEILVFTDVSVRLDPDAIQQMVSNFADPKVGCVSSEDRVPGQDRGWMGEWRFLQFDSWLRRLESNASSLVGVSGSFFAARRPVCSLWHHDQSSDFFVALHAVFLGFRTVVDPHSIGHYGLLREDRAEFHRKVRTIVHGLEVFFAHLGLLDPVRYGLFSLALISHKLFRWLVPFAAAALLVSSISLWDAGVFYRACALAQLATYGTGLLALVLSSFFDLRWLRLTSFVVMGFGATLVAWAKFISGETFATWQPSRRT